MEKELLNLLTGEFGGLLAVAYLMGVITSWGFFDKKVLVEHKKITERLRKEMATQREECQKETERLDNRIRDLEGQVLRLTSMPKKPYISDKFKVD